MKRSRRSIAASKGALALASKLGPEGRRERASLAALARWHPELLDELRARQSQVTAEEEQARTAPYQGGIATSRAAAALLFSNATCLRGMTWGEARARSLVLSRARAL
jgi:hypothetical protein